MASSRLVHARMSMILVLWRVWLIDARCTYVVVGDLAYPIDVCSTRYDFAPFYSGSGQYKCASDGSVVESLYGNGDCQGMPIQNSTIDMQSGMIDYNCVGSSSDCQLVEISSTSCDSDTDSLTPDLSYSYTLTVVANQCPTSGGLLVNCNSGSSSSQRLASCGDNPADISTVASENVPDCSRIGSCYDGSGSTADSSSSDGTTMWIIIGSAVVVVGLLCLFWCVCCRGSSGQPSQKAVDATPAIATVNYDRVARAPPQPIYQYPLQPLGQPRTFVAPDLPIVIVASTSGDGDMLPSYDDLHETTPAATASVEELPPDWVKLVTPDGRVYFQNNVTKKTQWTKPATEMPLPSGWRRVYDPDGSAYFMNDVTKQAQWEFPSAPANSQLPPYVPNSQYGSGGQDHINELPQYEGGGGYTNQ